jgi:hypothetical protein
MQYYVAGYPFPRSSVLCWPVDVREMPGKPDLQFFTPVGGLQEPVFVPIFTLDESEIQATTFTWRSWLWQTHTVPLAAQELDLAVRPVLDGPFEPVLKACARRAFFQLPKADLLQRCAYVGLDVGDGASLFDVVCKLCGHLLGADEEGVLRVAHARLAAHVMDSEMSRELLEIDGAVECLDFNDHKRLRQEQASAKDEAARPRAMCVDRRVLGRGAGSPCKWNCFACAPT